MNELEQLLWVRVFSAEYEQLAKRAAACFSPDIVIKDWTVGCSNTGMECERLAEQAADSAVRLFRDRK